MLFNLSKHSGLIIANFPTLMQSSTPTSLFYTLRKIIHLIYLHLKIYIWRYEFFIFWVNNYYCEIKKKNSLFSFEEIFSVFIWLALEVGSSEPLLPFATGKGVKIACTFPSVAFARWPRFFPCPLVELTRFWCAFIDLFAGATQVGIIKCQHTPFSISRQILGLPCLLDSRLADNSCSQSKWPSWHTLEFVCYNLKLSTMAAVACWPRWSWPTASADCESIRWIPVPEGGVVGIPVPSEQWAVFSCQLETGNNQLAHVPHGVCLITNKGKQRVGPS